MGTRLSPGGHLRLFWSVIGALLLWTTSARGQSPSEPSLAFTISAGMSTGQKLWSIDNQTLIVSGGQGATDSVGLARSIRPGIAASLGLSYYRSPHWGLNAEIAYFGLSRSTSRPAHARTASTWPPAP